MGWQGKQVLGAGELTVALRISPSLVDNYRYWRDTDFPDPAKAAEKLEEVLAGIRGEKGEPTEAMVRGTAWHRALEMVNGSEGAMEISESGHLFRFDAQEVAQVRQQLPAMTNQELRGRLDLPEIGAVMHLRTDGVTGNTIHEHKTTGRVDVDRYIRTSQWRAYLLAFECRVVVYHIVQLTKDRRANVWRVKDYLPFRQFAYPNMRRDLVADVAEVAAFIRSQGLTHYREETERANDF